MLKVDEYAKIRLAHRDGMSIRAIAKQFGHSRHTIRKVIKEAIPKRYTLRVPRSHRQLTKSFQEVIDGILASDVKAPKKQRHTAQRIFTRLRDEHGFQGGYDCVRRYLQRQRIETRETFLPLLVTSGQRAEADFGQIEVDFPEGRRLVSVLLVTWSYSNAVFAVALPSEKVEAILHGTTLAFEYFGCVPKELWWDNPKTVARSILQGRQRELNPWYQALASYYNFEPLFCQPARGNEKPYVEGRVKWMKQNWATPVPYVKDMEQLNVYLRDRCIADNARTVDGKEGSIQERFQQEQQAALALPMHPFDACISETRSIDKYQTLRWDDNRYSVPHSDAFSNVVVKAYVDRIEVFRNQRCIASHVRSYETLDTVLNPLHYLPILHRKPAYLDHTEVYKNWELPRDFADLREYFEQRHGKLRGARQYIQVLQLLVQHPQDRVLEAIRRCRRDGVTSAQRIIAQCGDLASRAQPQPALKTGDATPSSRSTSVGFELPLPDLSRFDALLSHSLGNQAASADLDATRGTQPTEPESFVSPSVTTHGGVLYADLERSRSQDGEARRDSPSVAVQSETTSITDDVIGVRQTGAGSRRCEPGFSRISPASDGVGIVHTSIECSAVPYSISWFSSGEGTGFF